MAAEMVRGREGLRALQGRELPPSQWIEVTQQRIDEFAAVTGDVQWLHIDAERAAHGPFGSTVAHGFLTLALLMPLLEAAVQIKGFQALVNYGLNRVRFPAPVPAGSRVRAHFRFDQIEETPTGLQALVLGTVEREGESKPACVAEMVLRFYDPA